jgi:hypothetical protein
MGIVAWETLCKPKEKGGMGLREPQAIRKSMADETMVEMG